MKKIIVEKKNNLARRVIEGIAVGLGISLGVQLPDMIVKLILLL